jgi:hypothetical protein
MDFELTNRRIYGLAMETLSSQSWKLPYLQPLSPAANLP